MLAGSAGTLVWPVELRREEKVRNESYSKREREKITVMDVDNLVDISYLQERFLIMDHRCINLRLSRKEILENTSHLV